MELRPSSIKEREHFYKKQFSVSKVKKWFKVKHDILALDAGTDTGIIKERKDSGNLFYFNLSEFKTMVNSYAPEDVYYDRNLYKNSYIKLNNLKEKSFSSNNFIGQELAFDIDPERIKCSCSKFCIECIRKTILSGIELKERLKKNYSRIGLIYSGRGCHVHVFDKDTYKLTLKERKKITEQLINFHVDIKVSSGDISLIRLPYSLNGLVSRIVIPIKNPYKFDPEFDQHTIPKFLK